MATCPAPLVQARDGNLWGTTRFGGPANQELLKMTTGGALTTVHSFASDCSDGYSPQAGLVQRDGNCQLRRRCSAARSVWAPSSESGRTGPSPRCTPSTAPTAAFRSRKRIQATDGNLYGTTSFAGPDGAAGTVFKITTGGALATLHAFSGDCEAEGCFPHAGLIQATDGNRY